MVERAVAALHEGEAVILPTDTVYGLCAVPERADRLAELKGRSGAMPVALLCAEVLPGPYTLVLPNPEGRFPELGGGGTIGVRVPVLRGAAAAIVAQVGAVAATSANRHHGADPRRLEDVPAELREACAAVVDGGELPGLASTVVDLTGTEPCVLREGAVPAAEALRRLGWKAE